MSYSIVYALVISIFSFSSLLGENHKLQVDFLTVQSLREHCSHSFSSDSFHSTVHQVFHCLPVFKKKFHLKKGCHRRPCSPCPPGPVGPPGATGATGPVGPTGATGPVGPAISSAAASRVIIAQDNDCIPVESGANFPFAVPNYGTRLIPEEGMTYDSTTNTFNFLQTGLYLVSYGFVLENVTPNALAALFLGGEKVVGSDIYNHEPENMCNATIIISVSDISQTLSLVNTSLGTLYLMANPYPGVSGLAPPMVAFITITRIADLPLP